MMLILWQAAAEYLGTVLASAMRLVGDAGGRAIGFVSTPRGALIVGVVVVVMIVLLGRKRRL